MRTIFSLRRGIAACAILTGVWLVSAATAADDDKALRKQALALNEVTGDEPIKGQLRSLFADSAGSKKLLGVAAKMVKEKNQPFNYTAASILAQVALKYKETETSIAFLKVCVTEATKLQSGSKLGQAYGGLMAAYYDVGKYAEAVKVCQEILEMRGDEEVRQLQLYAWETMVQALAKQGQTDLANKELDGRLEKQPDNWFLLELKAFVQREAGQYAEAAGTYEKALERVLKDKELNEKDRDTLVKSARYRLSGVYIDARNVAKAASHLQELLKGDPNNPSFNNDLGYIWADHDMNLDEAEKLIRKAIEEDRKIRKALAADAKSDEGDNAAYLDSLGWVLFKKKKYKDAKPYLEQAIKDPDDGQHVEIFDHLAEVQMALGEKTAAVATWKKALELPALGKRDQQRKAEIEKKIKKHQ